MPLPSFVGRISIAFAQAAGRRRGRGHCKVSPARGIFVDAAAAPTSPDQVYPSHHPEI